MKENLTPNKSSFHELFRLKNIYLVCGFSHTCSSCFFVVVFFFVCVCFFCFLLLFFFSPLALSQQIQQCELCWTILSSAHLRIGWYVNSFGAKFQTTFVVCFFFLILTNHLLERRLYVKLKDWMSNSVDPDETAHWAVSSGSMLFVRVYYYRLWQWKS